MMKLALATLLALLLPMFWVVAAKAQPPQAKSSIRMPTQQYDHLKAWTTTADNSMLNPQQQQALRLRDDINQRISQMYDSYRMLGDGQVYSPTARGLIAAAESIQTLSNQTTDFYSLESYNQRVQSLQSALQVVRQMN